MREYLVYAPSYHYDDLFIVQAHNAKEAINKVFNSKFKWKNKEIREDNKKLDIKRLHYFLKAILRQKVLNLFINNMEKYLDMIQEDG